MTMEQMESMPKFEKIRRPKDALERIRHDDQKLIWAMCLKKAQYTTHGEASRVVRKAKEMRGVKLRVYECPVCLKFHVTKSFEG